MSFDDLFILVVLIVIVVAVISFMRRQKSSTGSESTTTSTPSGQVGDTLTLTVKRDANDSEAVLQLEAVDGVFIFAPSATDGLAFGKYRYDIQLETAAGEVYTPIVSDFKLTEEVTWSASS